jgi:hypothetical protein
VFVSSRPFKTNVRLGDYPKVEYLKGASLVLALVLLRRIRLGWKSLPGTDTLAYKKHFQFITLVPTLTNMKIVFFAPKAATK